MIFLGVGEQFDHLVNGSLLTFGSAAYAAHLREVLDGMVQQAGGSPGHPVVLVDVPCHGVPVDPDEADGEIINDDSRTRWLNGQLVDFAAGSAGRAVVLDLHGFLCQDGYTNTRDGVRLRKDGLHFTDAGARIVWRWIADKLDELAPTGVPAGTVQAFVVGDSVAYGLHSRYTPGEVPGLAVAGSTELGCGLFPDLLVAEDKRIPAEPQCGPWAARWRGEVERLRPQLALLMIGSWEQYDRLADGRRLRVGTPAFATYLRQRVASYLDVLEKSAARVAITTVPCHHTPDFGLGPEPGVVNDDARVDAVNSVVRSVAAEHPEVAVVDLHDFLCGSGYREKMDGVQLRTDGLHFTDAGAALVWRWLGPQLVRLASPS
jgi:lysophospholipase L1-like esterase